MSLIQMDFMADSIQRWTTAEIYLPDAKQTAPLRALFLLHGYGGNHTDWLTRSNVMRLAERRNIALIMPDGDNSYFLNFPERNENYADYIARELPRMIRRTFPNISPRREDTFVGGLSMGGGAAVRLALTYPEVFAGAIGLSAGLTVEAEARSLGHEADLYDAYERYCAGMAETPSLDPVRLFLSIGTEDPLLEVNRDFHRFLVSEGFAHTYEEYPGGHNWDYWDTHARDMIDFAAGVCAQKEG